MGIDVTIITHPPRYEVCADHTFISDVANRRMGGRYPADWDERIQRPLGVAGAVGEYMAGMRCPTPERLTALTHDLSDIEDWEKQAVWSLFEQLSPAECDEFMVTTDASPREVARLMRECGVRRGLVVNWINQYSTDPDWHEDKALPIWWGDLWTTEDGHLRPRHR